MERRLRTNLLLVAVIAVLGGVIWLLPEPGPETPAVFLFEGDITRVEAFDDDGARFTLDAVDGEWWLRHPVALPADRFHVESLLGVLRAPARSRYSLSEAQPAELGLDEPVVRARINGEDIAVGGRTALGHERYVQKGDEIFLVSELFAYQLQRAPYDYASKRVLPEGAVIRVLELPSGARIARDRAGWRVEPDGENVSADELQRLIDAWQHAEALDVAPAASVPRDGEVRLELEGGDVLRFGVERREHDVVLSRDAPAVSYTLPLDTAESLLQLPSARE